MDLVSKYQKKMVGEDKLRADLLKYQQLQYQ